MCSEIDVMKKQIVFLVGPTAVGKSEVAVELANLLGGEIISCDSMQVYRGFDILSNKPSCKVRGSIKHHLVDILSPYEEFSVADFRRRALRLIKTIHIRKKVPLLVGGTGLYVKALIDGLFKAPKKDQKFRNRLQRYSNRYGANALHKRLLKVDPDAACKIHPNDLRRTIRALEIFELTKVPISKLQKRTQGLDSKYRIIIFGLRMPSDELYRHINERVDEMFAKGIAYEVRDIVKDARPLSLTASMALGIKELKGYLKGGYDLDETKRLLSRNTRRYARRQMIWFKADKRVEWIDITKNDKPQIIAKRIWKRLSLLR